MGDLNVESWIADRYASRSLRMCSSQSFCCSLSTFCMHFSSVRLNRSTIPFHCRWSGVVRVFLSCISHTFPWIQLTPNFCLDWNVPLLDPRSGLLSCPQKRLCFYCVRLLIGYGNRPFTQIIHHEEDRFPALLIRLSLSARKVRPSYIVAADLNFSLLEL